MKSRFLMLLGALALCLALLLSGCGSGPASGAKPSAAATASAPLPTGPKTSEAGGAPSATGTGSSASPAQTSSPKPSPSAAKPSANAPVEASWTMVVDQKIPKVVDGLTVNYTLLLVAQKSGGKDVNGTYKGAAYIGVNFDASQMDNSIMKVMGGFNVNAATYNLTFDVVGYDAGPYTDYAHKGDLPPLAPLVGHESMALLTPEMTGTGSLNVSVTAPNAQGGTSNSNSSSTAVPMKITIDSGKVRVDVPTMQLSHYFEGMVTGVPLTSSSPDNQIEQASAHIKSVMDQAADAAAAAAAAGGDLGSLMNQFKPK